MGRKRQSVFEDLIDIASLLPWWLALIIAVISYFIFNYFSQLPIPHAKDIQDLSSSVGKQFFIIFSGFLKYIVPVIFTIGAIASGFRVLKNANEFVSENPTCPNCGSSMKLRTAKKGENAGSQFWGCSTFPRCRGTLDI